MKIPLLLAALVVTASLLSGCAVHYTAGHATVSKATADDLAALHFRRAGG